MNEIEQETIKDQERREGQKPKLSEVEGHGFMCKVFDDPSDSAEWLSQLLYEHCRVEVRGFHGQGQKWACLVEVWK